MYSNAFQMMTQTDYAVHMSSSYWLISKFTNIKDTGQKLKMPMNISNLFCSQLFIRKHTAVEKIESSQSLVQLMRLIKAEL